MIQFKKNKSQYSEFECEGCLKMTNSESEIRVDTCDSYGCLINSINLCDECVDELVSKIISTK